MSTSTRLPSLERPAFFDGQRLDAADLASIGAYHRELRWLHNRTLHSWGIASGYVVTGQRGERQVTVTPGYALDCDGRDLVLGRAVTLPVPPIVGSAGGHPVTYYLTVSYADDAELTPSETRAGVCHDGGAVRLPETPRLRWQNPRDLSDPESRWRRGRDLVLASVPVQDCALAAAPSFAERREARPESQPFIAGGQTPPGATGWQFYPSAAAPLGVETVVDTSSAGFAMAPMYTAQVVGSRVLRGAGRGTGQLIDGVVTVADPSPVGFTARIMLPRDLAVPPYTLNPSAAINAALLPALGSVLRWYVTWTGVEGQA